MKSLRHFFGFLLSGVLLLASAPAYAQSNFLDVDPFYGEPIPRSDGTFLIDSFFDIDVSLDDALDDPCVLCEAIADDIAEVEWEIDGLKDDLEMLDGLMSSMEQEMDAVDSALEEARAQLAELTDPQSWVESEGRRYDSSDNAAMQRRSANLWSAYRAGKMTAQEYSDEVAKPFDDPDVARELEKIKKQLRKELEKSISDLKQRKKDGEAKLAEWDGLGKEMTQDLDALQAELDELLAALEECEKQCKETERNPELFGITPDARSFFDVFFDIFTPDPPVLPGITPPQIGIPVELIPLELSGGPIPINPLPGIDLGLDLGLDLPPPVCQACYPIWEQIVEFEDDLANLEWRQMINDLRVELLYDEKGKAHDDKGDLEDRLEELNNPPSSAESEGRRYDSNTHRAMKVRNARLWDAYRAGRLSAQDLSDEWAKPFDDPDVARELNDIIDAMKEELEDAIDDLDDTIDDLNDQIQEVTDELIDIAGRIGGLNVLLDHLYEDLDECERLCHEPQLPDLSGLFDGFDDILKGLEESLKQFEETQDDEDDSDDAFGRLTFNDLVIPKGTTSINMEDIIKKSNEYDSATGIVTIDEKRYRIGPGGTLVPEDEWDDEDDLDIQLDGASSSSSSEESSSEEKVGQLDEEDDAQEGIVVSNIGSSGEDGVSLEPEKRGILCDWFGWFCPKDEVSVNDLSICVSDPGAQNCDLLGEPKEWKPTLVLSDNVQFPLIINGLDGNDDLSAEDFDRLGECLFNGPPSCTGLDFLPPPGDDILFGDDLLNAGPGDFRLQIQGQGGNDILLGDPIRDDLINIHGGGNDILFGGPGTLPDDLIGPGGDDIIGGPPSIDILGETTSSEPSVANDPRAREVAQAAVRAYLQRNPLGPCEKLVVSVTRVRIGNRVRYTVRISRVRDESLCPKQCPEQTSYQSLGTSCDACQNGTAGCTVIDTLPDGTNCILCAPPSYDDTDEDEDDYDDGDGSDNDGGSDDLCEDVHCDDGDECTDDECDPDTGECTNTAIEGCGNDCSKNDLLPFASKADCEAGSPLCPSETAECQSHNTPNGDCWGCIPKEVDKISPCREDDRWVTDVEAKRECEKQGKDIQKVTDYCWGCKDKPTPTCDAPLVDHAGATALESGGEFECSPVRVDGLTCYDCKEVEVQCDYGLVSDCGDCPSGTECGARNSNGCHICNPLDDGPSCPSGTTSDLSACQSQCGAEGGVCVDEDQTGCYSCVVVNCPSGSSKECPSSCGNGCDVVGEQYGVKCYQCKQSCEDVCSQNGYHTSDYDHSSAILSELNGYSCVSGANISIQTATIGSCQCIGEYSLTVNQTPPVCTGTPCGDVTCGSSATCTEGDTTVTVNCNWGGWEQIGKQQFRPKVGN